MHDDTDGGLAEARDEVQVLNLYILRRRGNKRVI
jgi:hypothetical protein